MWYITPLVILAVGAVVLVADFSGRFFVAPARLRRFQWIAIAAAAGPGLAPLLGFVRGTLGASESFVIIAVAYVLAFITFAIGVLRWRPEPGATVLRRAGYVALLLLVALPSWVLVVLAPFVWISGVGLARVRPET